MQNNIDLILMGHFQAYHCISLHFNVKLNSCSRSSSAKNILAAKEPDQKQS